MSETLAVQERFEFHWDARRLTWLAGWIGVIGAAGLGLLLVDDWSVKALGLAWAAVFGIGVRALLRRRKISAPVVVVSADGVLDTRILAAPIPWSALNRVEAFEAENVPFIGLHFADIDAALAHAKPSVRRIAKVQRGLGFPPASINMSALDGSDEDLLAAIAVFRPELLA